MRQLSVLPQLLGASERQLGSNFTGSEIEQVFIEALYRAFDRGDEPTDLTIGEVLVDFVPLSKLMAEQMSALRTWAKGRVRPATTPQPEPKHRKIAA